jgi:hypothetical protein
MCNVGTGKPQTETDLVNYLGIREGKGMLTTMVMC